MKRYVSPFRRMAGWFLLFILFCTLAVQVKADIIYNPPGSPGNTAFRISCNGCAPGQSVNCYFIVWFYGSTGNQLDYTAGGVTLNSYNGSYQVLLVGAIVTGHMEEYWAAAGPGQTAIPQHTTEDNGPNNATPLSLPGVSTSDPYSDTGYPCGSSTPNQSNFNLQITNNTSGWEQLPNGNWLAPGASVNYNWAMASGTNGNGFVLDGTSPFNGNLYPTLSNGYAQQAGSTAPWTNWNLGWITNVASPSSLQSGASAGALANDPGGPIIWNSTNQGTIMEAGFQGTIESIQQSANEITNGLAHDIVLNMTNNSGGSSNVWVQNWPSNLVSGQFVSGTNSSGSSSNVWVRNWPFGTNVSTNGIISSMTANTQAAWSVLGSFSGSLSSIGSGLPSSPGDESGAPLSQNITIGNGGADTLLLTVGPIDNSITPFVSSLRSFIGWVLVFVCVVWNAKLTFEVMSSATQTPQTQGPDTGAVASSLGGNAITAFAAVAIIFGLLSAIPVVAVGLLSGEISFFGTQVSPSTWFTSNASYVGWLNQVFPLYMCLTLVGSQVAFFIGLRSFGVIIQTAVRLTIGM